ncbi:MAG: energy transducer TonB [Alphaproteobacteria bacterium]|nr:energy transducer TonB [Alphaproteobacteria bacterium]
MATSVFATWQGGAFPDERPAHGPDAGLSAANSNEVGGRSTAAGPAEGQTEYRAAGLYENRRLSWPAWVAALALHGAVALGAIALGWTSIPLSPLPETITVVFEAPPAPAAEPAPTAQTPVSTPQASEPTPAFIPSAPTTATAATVAVLPMPMPPPARPLPDIAAAPAHKPAAASAPPVFAAPSAEAASSPPSVAAPPAALALAPLIPPRPASGMAGNRKPVYPLAARSRRLEGRVMLQVQVAASGDPLAVRVVSSSGHSLLDDSALQAVRSWRFIPASQAGQAVAGSVDVPVDFRMAD